jgi:hypothetical protein
MNAYSRRRPDLNTLLISLEAESHARDGRIVFQLFISGEEAATAEMSCGKVGFPDSSADLGREYRYSEPEYHVSDEVIGALRAALDKHGMLDGPLWLELNPPGCSLPLVPWERLLQPGLGVPLLRRSFFQSGGAIPHSDWLDVVLCASAPVAKGTMPLPELVGDFTSRILDTRPGGVTIHVFSDQDGYRTLKRKLPNQVGAAGEHGVKLYDPATAIGYKPAERSRELRDEPRKVLNPWLAWMTDSLGGRTIDVMHFICHGLIYLDQGALALAESPCLNEDKGLARFVGVRQLNAFLDRTGAYTLALTSPPHNFSILGLRVLTEQVARTRPGVAFLHDYSLDREFLDLGATYRVLYVGDATEPPRSPALSLYCTPAALDKGGAAGAAADDSAALAKWTGGAAGGAHRVDKEEGAWVASGLRWIERTASQLGESAGGPVSQTATTEGIEDALKFVSDVLERHRLKR